MFVREKEWNNFAANVAKHIVEYTIPQYGDYPFDQCEEDFTVADISTNIKRYLNRMGKSQRGDEDQLRDCLKIAHYACIMYSKLAGLEPNKL